MASNDQRTQKVGPSTSTMLHGGIVRQHPDDDVAIAREVLSVGAVVHWHSEPGTRKGIAVRQTIPSGHKIALCDLCSGQPVRRYGQVIGLAGRDIRAGEHVHAHNLEVGDLERDAAGVRPAQPVHYVPEAEHLSFLGYRRADGRVGTRNYIAVISTVNCSAHACREIARAYTPERLAALPNVDGVLALTHHAGCPVRQTHLQRTLAGMACHPNVGAALLVGLGCETNQVDDVLSVGRDCFCGDLLSDRVDSLVIQDQGGLRSTIETGIAAVDRLLPQVNAARRTSEPISALTLALQCGGSDAWSGVTANPLVGGLSDEVVRQGGAVVLAETPEVYGAEHLLARRASNPDVADKLLAIVADWKRYAGRIDIGMDDNRSVGNAAGGLSTILEKSLGGMAKAGATPLLAVYDYAEAVTARGLAFMNSPGYDPMSVTGQVAGGCNLVLFTTGRGSVFGFKPSPTIKISTNTALFERMRGDVDLDAGRLLSGVAMEDLAAELLDMVLAVASGQPSKSEAQGVGEAEFCPWTPEGTL